MSDPYVGEVRLFSFGFVPKDWAACNGQTMAIEQNTALFSLLGTTYGGNGQTTFALPNLQGAAPIHQGAGFVMGQTGGAIAHTLLQSELPSHTHTVSGRPDGTTGSPASATWAVSSKVAFGSGTGPNPVPMAPSAIGQTGSSQPHDNLPPYLAMNYCMALFGIFPPRN
jgi:microcystin-dependent protein